MNSYSGFAKELQICRNAIGYFPLLGEPKPPLFPLIIAASVPADPSANPVAVAREFSARFEKAAVCVYIPGTAFDARGTRHGRGGGWYDRFLASIPGQWLRIGFCHESTFSAVNLVREAWDQPVDWVCVQTSSGTNYYKTNARIIA